MSIPVVVLSKTFVRGRLILGSWVSIQLWTRTFASTDCGVLRS